MYSSELNTLIELALADGILTEKERRILIKRANDEGVDIDEFQMVLEAKLFEFQKKTQANSKKNNIIRCPHCNDVIPALSRICPSCDYIINDRSSSSDKGVEGLIEEIETSLIKIKELPKENVFSAISRYSYISLPLLTIIITIGGTRLTFGTPTLLLVLIFSITLIIVSIKTIFKKFKNENHAVDNSNIYRQQKAVFEKLNRNAQTLYGENIKVRILLNNLKIELNKIEERKGLEKKIKISTFIILIILTIASFFIPTAKTDYENEIANKNADKELILKIEDLISNHQLLEATQLITDLKSDESVVLVKSKIQLSKLTEELNHLEPLIDKKEYSKIKFELEKINWQKISTDYNTKDVERDVFESFLNRKNAINNQLPENMRIEIKSKYSL